MLTFQKYVHFMRTQFPPGSRVLLLSNDSPRPVPDGTMGTLTEVDAAGRFLVNWDTGKRTALNLEDDHPSTGNFTPAMSGATWQTTQKNWPAASLPLTLGTFGRPSRRTSSRKNGSAG